MDKEILRKRHKADDSLSIWTFSFIFHFVIQYYEVIHQWVVWFCVMPLNRKPGWKHDFVYIKVCVCTDLKMFIYFLLPPHRKEKHWYDRIVFLFPNPSCTDTTCMHLREEFGYLNSIERWKKNLFFVHTIQQLHCFHNRSLQGRGCHDRVIYWKNSVNGT